MIIIFLGVPDSRKSTAAELLVEWREKVKEITNGKNVFTIYLHCSLTSYSFIFKNCC